MRRKKMAESQLLIPKSFKEKQAKAARKRYAKSVIWVQFPDVVVLQGVFSPWEPTSAIYEVTSHSHFFDFLFIPFLVLATQAQRNGLTFEVSFFFRTFNHDMVDCSV